MKHDLEKTSNKPALKGGLMKKYENISILISATQKELGEVELPRMFNQLVLFIIDGSRSMKSLSINKISKGKDIENNIHHIIKRLKSSKNKSSFDIVSLSFSDTHVNAFGIKAVKEIVESDCFNPVQIIKEPRGTFLLPALQEANEIIESYFQLHEGKRKAATILLMTDGAISDYKKSAAFVEEMKLSNNIVFSVSFLESSIEEGSKWYSWNEETNKLDYENEWTIEEVKKDEVKIAEKLSVLATSEEHFSTTVDPEKVRSQMIKSISLVSKMLEQ